MAPAADEAPPLGTGGSDSRAQVLVVVRAHPVPPALCAVRDELGKEVGKCTMVGVGDAAGDGGWRCAYGRCRPQVSPKSFGTRVRGIDTNQNFQTPVTGLNYAWGVGCSGASGGSARCEGGGRRSGSIGVYLKIPGWTCTHVFWPISGLWGRARPCSSPPTTAHGCTFGARQHCNTSHSHSQRHVFSAMRGIFRARCHTLQFC